MVGAMDNSYKPHQIYQVEEVGFVTDWEAMEEPQNLFEREVLQGGP